MRFIFFLIITVGLLFFQTTLKAQAFKLKNYKMVVKGTSSLHDWESAVEKVECKGYYAIVNSALAEVKDVAVKISVASIKSTKGRMMDNKTYEAFNYEKYPDILFILNTKKIVADNSTIVLKGTLSMAGVSKPIELTVSYKILPQGEVQILGSKKIIMTDFKMEPPTAMMGTIKVDKEVVIDFDMTLSTNNTIL